MSVRDEMETRLRAALAPSVLEVVDESAKHAGHAGARPGGETHFQVTIRAERFVGLDRLARHRLINGVLADLLASRVHALAITAKAPGEA